MYLGIDLGGTRIKGVVINQEGQVLHQAYTPTNDGVPGQWQLAVKQTVGQLSAAMGIPPLGIGISAPGLPNSLNTAIAYMPERLIGLENLVWSEFLGQSAWVINDAVAALVAEAKTGAAVGSSHAIMVTLGTGVGGALLIHGKPFQGAFCKAGHIGHTVVDSDGDSDVTGMPGSLEDCIGNCTIVKRTGGKFSSTHQMLLAMRQGDILAQQVWQTSVRKLAAALASFSNFISPDTIIVGGGIAQADEDLFGPLNHWFDIYEWQPGGIRPKIVKATHGDLAGAIGAACYATNQV